MFYQRRRRQRRLLLALKIIINSQPSPDDSRPDKRPNKDRDHVEGQVRIFKDYFSSSPVLGPESFQRRHRIPLSVYEEMKAAILDWERDNCDPSERFFEQRADCCGRVGASADQKLLAALRMLASGHSPDDAEAYYGISETVAAKSLMLLCQRLVDVWGAEYLREPTVDDVQNNSNENAQRGFPVLSSTSNAVLTAQGMFGSIDCYHWTWHGYPRAHHGSDQNGHGDHNVALQLIAVVHLFSLISPAPPLLFFF